MALGLPGIIGNDLLGLGEPGGIDWFLRPLHHPTSIYQGWP
jgi:hypothetical protein